MKFRILCDKGDAGYDYDTDMAQIKFDELIKDNYLPMKVEQGKHLPMKTFDPSINEVVWMPNIMGG